MAADTTALYLQTGTIRDSVNFPTTTLPARLDTVQRVCVVNENRPGMLGEILSVFGNAGINIVQQINTSKGDVGYNVIESSARRPSTRHFKARTRCHIDVAGWGQIYSLHRNTPPAKHAGYSGELQGRFMGLGGIWSTLARRAAERFRPHMRGVKSSRSLASGAIRRFPGRRVGRPRCPAPQRAN